MEEKEEKVQATEEMQVAPEEEIEKINPLTLSTSTSNSIIERN